ncbi:protein-tyrosine phosphatase-like protein [Multifurca ochricompacta]|uniref:Protein-tyrosine phosphatase-like protein n=1 Tax=Multifurca ochricompacta TaxID=376703 RepID=A0AAD4MAC8_9AGAM|nr:protein-tyrosine phosphatase-like protein [Multifurca ochricompacta]
MLSTLSTADVLVKTDVATALRTGGTVQAWSMSVAELDLEKKLAVQLMHLASQFHASDYACAKFGAGGSAIAYIPLSINLPEHFKQLKERQALYADTEPWWLCEPEPQKTPPDAAQLEPKPLLYTSHPVAVTQASPNIQYELRSAIDTPLIPPAWLKGEAPLPKTSDTHPISVSAIIPQELLSSISLHISLADSSSPTIFNVHPAFSLHRLTSPPEPLLTPLPVAPGSSLSDRPMSAVRLISKVPSPHSTAPSRTHLQIWSRVSMKSALQSALATNIHQPAQQSVSTPNISIAPRLPPLAFGSIDLIGEIFSTSHFELDANRSPGASLQTRHERTFSVPATASQAVSRDSTNRIRYPQNKRPHPTSFFPSAKGITHIPKFANSGPRLVPHLTSFNEFSRPASPALGNLYLSSCPGKKVRLTGPVRGRGAVCRDLNQDLRRIKALGVGCIVCCLDDEELSFLGAPWPEYSHAARELGLDILRIPIPEGLAPASLEQFDAHLTRLVSIYTLTGIPVLAHCRGGVGRAGLVACCWMLKLGLCGWVPTSDNTQSVNEGQVRRDTLEQVEKVIGVVRRRRSLKAIETYEQVKFLVGYVDYLRGIIPKVNK